MCRSDLVLSGNGSVMTTGVGEDGNREVGPWDRLPVRRWSPKPTAKSSRHRLDIEVVVSADGFPPQTGLP